MKIENLKLHAPYLDNDAIFYEKVYPAPLYGAYLISFNTQLASEMGLSKEQDATLLRDWFNGDYLINGSEPFAMGYAGHQFGRFVPELGDGRAINLGKLGSYNLQLKGAGPTQYSRMGDGRAVLRSSIREYLISEAMHGLGIATTRALGIVGSTHKVARKEIETGAMVMRTASSWVRFGTFEYFYYQGNHDALKTLADFVIAESYPHLQGEENAYLLMYEELIDKTALLIAQWQSVGFNHGVMNTDNMSIAGLTLDYGPFAFFDAYNPDFVCNRSDHEGRYSFSNQARIAHWNLQQLAKAMSPLVQLTSLEIALEKFGPRYGGYFLEIMAKKIGLSCCEVSDKQRIEALLDILEFEAIDYTVFFTNLSHYNDDRTLILSMFRNSDDISSWLDAYEKRLEALEITPNQRREQMRAINPRYVLKNYMLQEAIDKALEEDFTLVHDLLAIAQAPYDEHKGFEHYAKESPHKLKNSRLSCSS